MYSQTNTKTIHVYTNKYTDNTCIYKQIHKDNTCIHKQIHRDNTCIHKQIHKMYTLVRQTTFLGMRVHFQDVVGYVVRTHNDTYTYIPRNY